MPSESKNLLTAQTEKPNHYSYLKEFRVDQCPLFLQHKCTNHRPFTCFHWHFMNQRRRRPVRKRDGSFNYCADTYCVKYDETTGLCPDGDECPFLHRTAGDTERRYHLRYFKTCMCVHETDSRGFCTKNGPHCAFAHGQVDLRPPVFDIKELQEMENPDSQTNIDMKGPNALDKERNLMNEDPKWQDTNYVLLNYKTEMCKRPPRLCRQGYACPQYHNSRDKRRSPKKYKYRSTPCPNVKHGDEWGEPENCDVGESCSYCHTRTEQQFHPEIYKSTKCNDVQSAGYCPRGVFCAFAHLEEEMALARDLAARIETGTNLADLLSSALPPDKCQEKDKDSSGSGEVSESASTSSLGSNSSHSKAPGSQLTHGKVSNPLGFNSQHDLMHATLMKKQLMGIDSGMEPLLDSTHRKPNVSMAYSINNASHQLGPGVSPLGMQFFPSDTLDSLVGNALDELHLDEAINFSTPLDKELERDSPINTLSAGLASSGFGMLGSSAPMNIPGSALSERQLGNFSPTSSPLQSQPYLTGSSRFSFQDSQDSNLFQSSAFTNHIMSNSSLGNNIGGGYHSSGLNSGSLFDYGLHPNLSPPSNHPSVQYSPHTNANNYSGQQNQSSNGAFSESQLRGLIEEVAMSRNKLASWDERIAQARTACEAWQREAEESNRKANVAEKERDEALQHFKVLKQEIEMLQGSPYLHCVRRTSELGSLSLQILKQLQEQLRNDCEKIDQVIYAQMASTCMVCEEDKRSVTLGPCNHYVLCTNCAKTQKECPYCQTPINGGMNL